MYQKKVKEKKNSELHIRKNYQSNRRKQVDSYDKKTFMRIQFIWEVYVYGQK